jgi:alpha-methylacyl-CoA racemase
MGASRAFSRNVFCGYKRAIYRQWQTGGDGVTVPNSRTGPLTGIRVLEFAGIGPGPFCGMLLADLGADVIRIDRKGGNKWPNPVVDRGRSGVIVLNLKSDDGRMLCLSAADKADVLLEGFRPGVMERLGLGPELLLPRNPRLIYGRITGWGQTGPLARRAGHDINYIALAGALAAIGRDDRPPVPPLNLLGDFGGGALYLAFGIVSALYERERSGTGQIVDCAIVDGAASLMAMLIGMSSAGALSSDRARALLGGAAPFYRCYTCSDGRHISIGAIEPKFYAALLQRIGAPSELLTQQDDVATWDMVSDRIAQIFRTKTQSEWCRLLEEADVCFAPVLTTQAAADHPHLKTRDTYLHINGLSQPGPAPRFSRTPGSVQRSTLAPGDGREALTAWGVEILPDQCSRPEAKSTME